MSALSSRISSSHAGEAAKRAAFFQLVKSQLGVPYHWGGDSPVSGFDCSGLVKWAASRMGIDLPHYTVDQFSDLAATDTPRKGDLVFFNVPSDGPAVDQPGHVGVCANDGCSLMVNAPQPGGVVDQVPTNPQNWGSIMGYRSLFAQGQGKLPTGKLNLNGAANGAGGAANATETSSASKSVQCRSDKYAINFSPAGGIPLLSSATEIQLLNQCQQKAIISGLLLGVGGVVLITGVVLLSQSLRGQPLAVPGVKTTARAFRAGTDVGFGALLGAVAGPEGATAGATAGASKALSKKGRTGRLSSALIDNANPAKPPSNKETPRQREDRAWAEMQARGTALTSHDLRRERRTRSTSSADDFILLPPAKKDPNYRAPPPGKQRWVSPYDLKTPMPAPGKPISKAPKVKGRSNNKRRRKRRKR